MYTTILQIIGIGLAATALLLAVEQHFAGTFRTKIANLSEHIQDRLNELEKEFKSDSDIKNFEDIIEIQNKQKQLQMLEWDDISSFSGISRFMKVEGLFVSSIFLSSLAYWLLIFISSAEETILHNSDMFYFIDLRKLIDTETVFAITWVTLLTHLAIMLIFYAKVHFVFRELKKHRSTFDRTIDDARVELNLCAAEQPPSPPTPAPPAS